MTLKDKVLAEIKNNLDLVEDDDFDRLYEKVSRLTFNIGDEGALGMLSDILIEAGIDPLSVASPREDMFAYSEKVKSIDYKYNRVPLGMFMMSSLENISFTSDLNEIEFPAFLRCKNLTSIDLSNTNLKQLEPKTFQECENMTSIVLPDHLLTLPNDFLIGCSSLEKVVLPKNLEGIWEYTFNGCESLKELTLPKSVRNIRGFAFAGTGLEKLNYEGTVNGWKSGVRKSTEWREHSNITEVVCSDGVVKYKHL